MSRPRTRSSLEATRTGLFRPQSPNYGLVPNIGSSKGSNTAKQANTYFLSADTITNSTPSMNIAANAYTTLFNSFVSLPNIPFNQKTAQNTYPVQAQSSGSMTISQGKTLLFRVYATLLTAPTTFTPHISASPQVSGDSGPLSSSGVLNAGQTYRNFGANVKIVAYNPTGAIISNVVVQFSIHGDLVAGLPSSS